MKRRFLNAKIHRAVVTAADLHYEGSMGIGRSLLEAAGIGEHEEVLCVNLSNGERWTTYAIEAADGEIVLNGAAARLGTRGDLVIIMAFADLEPAEIAGHRPRIVRADDRNRPI